MRFEKRGLRRLVALLIVLMILIGLLVSPSEGRRKKKKDRGKGEGKNSKKGAQPGSGGGKDAEKKSLGGRGGSHGNKEGRFRDRDRDPRGGFGGRKKRIRPKGMQRETVFSTAKGNFTWPHREQVVVVEGNITIGGLMMVHERDEDMICGKIMPQGGMQATEAMLYAVDYVNRRGIIPGIRLGARIKDDCDRDIYGLEQSVDFIRGSISNIGGSQYECKDGSKPEMIAGVVGAPSSVTSIQVANLLKLFKIPQVSFFSTSPALSSEQRYPFFMRTIPSDKNQAEAMVELVKLFNWTYVAGVYEESSYGQMGFAEVEELLKKEGICLATTAKLTKDSGVAAASSYDNIVHDLKKTNTRGVIVFGSDQEVGELMRAIDRNNMTGYFTWIGSDGWGGRTLVSDGNEAQVEGAVTVQPFAEPIRGFEQYFLSLTPETNTRNPWFIEYWEDYFKCRFPNSSETPFNQNYSRTCNGSERQTRFNGYVAEAQLQFVSDAVMAFSYAVRNMHQDYCGGQKFPGFCPEFNPYDGELLREYLLNVKFRGLSGHRFRFLPNGDPPAKYRILNFRQPRRGHYEWVTVGTYDQKKLSVDMNRMKFTYSDPKHPSSMCGRRCLYNEAQDFVDDTHCCWSCIPCTTFQYLPTPYACVECPMGTKPRRDLKVCIAIPQEYLSYDSYIAIAAMIIAALGFLVTSYVIYVFIKFRETPVVKASGRELSFVLLGGILSCYGMTFVIIMKPNDIVCGAQKFGIGLCFAVCYSALLTKTNRIARIFRAGKRTVKRPKFISPKSQLFICVGLVSIQVIIGVVWMVMSPPKAGSYYPTRWDNQLVCISAVGTKYMIGFAYPIVLIIVCTIYAVLTRTIPEAFNESKYIGFTMYTTCIIWLAFVPIYFSTANNIEIRLSTMCFSISLSATVSLACLFTPKMHIILFHPERNIRQSMMSKVSTKVNSASSCRVDSGTQSDGATLRVESRLAPLEVAPDGSFKNYSLLHSSSLSDLGEIELHQRLKPSGSLSSGISRSTSATQTYSNGTSISTQTLDSVGQDFDDMDVQL